MKKIIFFLLAALILTACQPSPESMTPQPQVTITLTETPIPAPTLHPQFVELQQTIAAAGERYTLDASTGYIYDGAEAIPGLRVTPDGTMTLEVGGEVVKLDPSKVSFDDKGGVIIDGYKLDADGKWVEAVSEAVLQAQAEFEEYGYVFSPDYIILDDQGWVKITDPETGIDIYVDGKFDLRFVVENASDSKPTPYEPKPESRVGVPNRPPDVATHQYFVPLFARMREVFALEYGFDPFTNDKSSYSELMIDLEKLSYGIVAVVDRNSPQEQYFVYETIEGTIKIVPLKSGSREQTMMFWVEP